MLSRTVSRDPQLHMKLVRSRPSPLAVDGSFSRRKNAINVRKDRSWGQPLALDDSLLSSDTDSQTFFISVFPAFGEVRGQGLCPSSAALSGPTHAASLAPLQGRSASGLTHYLHPAPKLTTSLLSFLQPLVILQTHS